MPASHGGPSVALHIGSDDDRKVVAVPLRRTEPDGTLVLAIRHPAELSIGRVLTISRPSETEWQIERRQVEAPRADKHEDAGLLRLGPMPGDVPAHGPGQGEERPGQRPEEPAPATQEALQAGPQPPNQPRLREWQGRDPLGNVALRLSSGRVRTMHVRRIDEEGALVLAARRPGVLADGVQVTIAWSDRRGWLTATTAVLPQRPDGHAEAGLLRLGLQAAPQEQKERRAGRRSAIRLGLRASVERGPAALRGARFECKTLDIAVGGAAFASDLDLARGDRLVLRLIGPSGQLPGGEIRAEVLRREALPSGPEHKVVVAWRDPPKELQRALRRLIDSSE